MISSTTLTITERTALQYCMYTMEIYMQSSCSPLLIITSLICTTPHAAPASVHVEKAVAIDTNSLVALRATKLLSTPTQSIQFNNFTTSTRESSPDNQKGTQSRDYILITAQYR